MAKLVGRKKNNLPVEVEVAAGGTGTKTAVLIADGNTVIMKNKPGGKIGKGGFDKLK